jgi:hypothetical protein
MAGEVRKVVMSPKKWPWRRLGLGAAILVVGGVACWLIAILGSSTPNNSPSFSPPTTTTPFPDQTVSVTIPTNVLYPGTGQTPDNADKVPPDQPGIVPVVIPGAVFDKLAPARELWVHSPSPSLISTWGAPGSAMLVGLVALFGVLRSSHTTRISDARSEWFRRFEAALQLALSKDDAARNDLGVRLLIQYTGSGLAGPEEKSLALSVFAQVMESALAEAGVDDPSAPTDPDQSDVEFVVPQPGEVSEATGRSGA